MEIIKAIDLGHSYGDKFIFEHVNFGILKGSITGLLGKNGAGKTTIINIINGFLEPTHGSTNLFGEPVQNINQSTKSKIAFLIEGHIQYDFMTISQIEKFYSGFYPHWNKKKYYELIDLLKLKTSHKIANMSCGQRSQVALGLIFAQQPELIILDDFSMGLDPGYRKLFQDYLLHYVKKDGITVFVTSHIVQDMEKLIDEIMIMHNHKLAYKAPLTEFMKTMHMYSIPRDKYYHGMEKSMNGVLNIEVLKDEVQFFMSKELAQMKYQAKSVGLDPQYINQVALSLEDAFIGLTGRY